MFTIIEIHNTNIYLEIRIDTVENHQYENSPDKVEDTTTIIDAREAREAHAMRQSEVRDQFQKEKKQEYRDKKQAKIMYVN